MSIDGKRILVTRSAEQAPALSNALLDLGATPIVVPMIEIVSPASFEELDKAIKSLSEIDYLILTSVNAVQSFCHRLQYLGIDLDQLQTLKTVAVGPKSAAEFAALGGTATLVPDDYRAEGVVELLKDNVKGKRVLYPKAALARDLIQKELRGAGAELIAPVAYDSAPPADASRRLKQAIDEGLDLLTFTASSTVDNFISLLEGRELEKAKEIPVASIGPLTTRTAEKYGLSVAVEPDNSTLDDMIISICSYFEED